MRINTVLNMFPQPKIQVLTWTRRLANIRQNWHSAAAEPIPLLTAQIAQWQGRKRPACGPRPAGTKSQWSNIITRQPRSGPRGEHLPERWQSGRMRRFAKPVYGVNLYRGFESRPLRSSLTHYAATKSQVLATTCCAAAGYGVSARDCLLYRSRPRSICTGLAGFLSFLA